AGLVVGLLLGLRPAGAEETRTRLTARPRPSGRAIQPLAAGDEIRTETGQRRHFRLPDGSSLYVNQNTALKLDTASHLSLVAGEVVVEGAPTSRPERATPFVIQAPQRTVTGVNSKFAVQTRPAGTGVVALRGPVKVSGLEGALQAGQ